MLKVQNGRIYSFDGFELDAANRQLRRENRPHPLPAKAFDILVALVENNGRLVSKDEIFSSVWRDQIVEESNLTVHISQIRKALGENKNSPRYIETVPGYGYRFVGDVSDVNGDELVIETETLSRITIEKELGPSTEAVGLLPATDNLSQKTKFYFAGGAFLVLLFVGGSFWLFSRNQDRNSIAPPVASAERQSTIKRLTNKGMADNAVLSPDGKFFAYTVRERDSYQVSLWVGQTNGNSDVQLRPAENLIYYPRSFSADSNWLYYTVTKPREFDNGTLYKMPVLGGVPQKLNNRINVNVVLSPDEKQIAFVRDDKENETETIVIANLDGSDERAIVVHSSERSILSSGLSWSADGALIGFVGASGKGKSQEIFAANVVSREVKQITALEWRSISSIEWLRDGSGLVAVAREKNSFVANQLWRIDYESGKAQNITRDLQHYGSPLSLSADSNALVALQATPESHIWIAPAENLAAARQITFRSSGLEGWYGIDWTPDGKIIYTARSDQSLTLWTIDANGEGAKQITSAGFLDQRASATADGKHIVFQSNRSGATEIWRVNFDGADLQQLTTSGGNTVPHVTPDGKTIVYSHESDGANYIWRISIEGGEAVKITDKRSSNPRVSPDGNFIACSYVENGKTKLAIVPITGGTPIKLFDLPVTYNFTGSIRWTRDGRFISYRDWAKGVWSQSVDGGDPVQLEGLPAEKLLQFDWSPDSKQFAFTRGREVRDVVLISDFR